MPLRVLPVEVLADAISEYITWCNTERIQERLKGLTPMQYRNQPLKPHQTNFWGQVQGSLELSALLPTGDKLKPADQ
ncbi:IS3 family transposase [Corynebacterium stercoris]|uniref:IS3 family transposase n=1 Tax=Corynebacterium stercoris TaxID=2943490 RepID=UPI003462CD84